MAVKRGETGDYRPLAVDLFLHALHIFPPNQDFFSTPPHAANSPIGLSGKRHLRYN